MSSNVISNAVYQSVIIVWFCKIGIRQWKGTDFAGPQHAVNVAQQSDEGGFSVQANRASCVLVRQEPTCPAEAGDFSPKSKNQKKWSSQILLSGQTLFKYDLKSNNIVVYKDSNKKIINKKKLYLTISQNGRSISFTDSFVLHIVPFNFHESPITSYSIFGHTTNLHMRGSIVKSLVLATPLALVYPSPFSTTIFPSATTSHSFLCSHRIYPYP